MLGTTIKLNGSNYLLGAHVSYIHDAQNKLAYLLQDPPATSDPTYVTWILDSRASSHMTGIKQEFVSLKFVTCSPFVKIADGTHSPGYFILDPY